MYFINLQIRGKHNCLLHPEDNIKYIWLKWYSCLIQANANVICFNYSVQFSSVQFNRSVIRLFATPQIAARQASLSITNSRSSLKLMSESMMPSSHLILCCRLLLLPSIPPSIRIFSNESTLHMRWPKYWSFSLNYYKLWNWTKNKAKL